MTPKLLLADDSVTIQRVIELTFADENVQVLAVGDGRQAIERVKADRPDIVLADVGMPERDGYEVAAFIKADPQLAHIPVLLLTGAFEPIDEAKARAVGCDGVLVKPFEPQMVISRVRELLAGKRTPDQPSGRPGHATHLAPVTAGPEHKESQPAESAQAGGGSLEDYFDRLDAALASKGTSTPTPTPVGAPIPLKAPYKPAAPAAAATPFPAPPPERVKPPSPPPPQAPTGLAREALAPSDLGGWDPSTPGDPVRPVSPPPVAKPAPVVGTPAAPAPPAPAAPVAQEVVLQPPALQDAFAALLAAEQGLTIAPPVQRADPPSAQFIDEIANRVIARMGDDSMRAAVLDAAERLVREEIARIKSQK